MKKLLVGAAVALTLTGCAATTNISSNSAQLSTVIPTNVKADVKVGGKITGSAEYQRFLFITTKEENKRYADGVSYGAQGTRVIPAQISVANRIELLKAAAAYDAVQSAGADVILAPKYIIEDDNKFFTRTIKVRVEGNAGSVTLK